MTRTLPIAAALLVPLAVLAGCHNQEAPDAPASAAAAPDVAASVDPTEGPTPHPATPVPVRPGEDIAREKAARGVLLDWARALELRQFGKAYAQFSPGAAPGEMTGEAYGKAFAPWTRITVAMPVGVLEAEDAGYFYRAPTTIKLEGGGKARTLTGTVVLYNEGDGQPWVITAANGLTP